MSADWGAEKAGTMEARRERGVRGEFFKWKIVPRLDTEWKQEQPAIGPREPSQVHAILGSPGMRWETQGGGGAADLAIG